MREDTDKARETFYDQNSDAIGKTSRENEG